MARIIDSPPGGTPPNKFEQSVLDTFQRQLPKQYYLLPNFILKQGPERNAYEMDIVVLAPHAIYVVECKEWYGRLTGDDWEWLLNDRHAFGKPMDLLEIKCKVLKSFLGAPAQRARVSPLYVLPDATRIQITGGWKQHCLTLSQSLKFLQEPARIGVTSASLSQSDQQTLVRIIQGSWGKRIRAPRKKVGSYNLVDMLHEEEGGAKTYLAHHALITDNSKYRVRIWNLSPQLSEAESKERLNVIRRPTEAVAQIGSHPNLLRVLQFDELPNEFGFYEVTEWSEFGTLHGYLNNSSRPQLTVRERLEIAAGIANALVAVHAKTIVHRNICPETILIGFDLKPHLTDFDRAYLKRGSAATVFAATKTRNEAYLPPELADPVDYDFSTKSDMYCFGVLLYELLVGNPPFAKSEEAIAASGVPPQLPSDVRGNVPPEIDQLVLDLLRVDDFNARPTAQDALDMLNQVLQGTTAVSIPSTESTQEPEPISFTEGSIIASYYKVESRLGEGSFSTVYKVQHVVQGKYYAMKVLKDQGQAEVMFQEFGTGDMLPQHKNIAAIKWLSRLPPPDNTPYILSEFIDGEPLTPYCDGSKILPLSEIQRIVLALLDALDAIHPKTDRINQLKKKTLTADEADELELLRQSGILHRDIKPQNILLDQRSNPKLIDFNIAVVAENAVGRGGTPRYWAPDRGQPEWEPSADLFSLGVVLYELVTHRHPYANNTPGNGTPYDPRQIAPEISISQEFADFLLKAVKPARNQRFQTAAQMREALQQLPILHAATLPVPSTNFADLNLESDEVGRPDYNPYVTRLLTLYSQARRSNAGTRGLDDIARLTYVQTKLDTALTPAILDGQFRLVIVTGNAGDGKTAFLQQLEARFEQEGATLDRLSSGNGAEWIYDGITYASNYDGSQDEGSIENDAVLANFLVPFKGNSLAGLSKQHARIIAINEGRLRDFLDHSPLRNKFEGLRRAVLGFFLNGQNPPKGMLVVNLNLRAIAAGGSGSLMEQQLQAMLKPEIWAPCEACSLKQRCPLKANADTLSDTSSGPLVRARIRRLFEVVHLRRQQHVTMRDLRSALSYLLLRDHGCEDVARILGSEDATEVLIRLSYTEAFAQQDNSAFNQSGIQVTEDRLVRLLREADVGQVDTPDLDRKLAFDPETAVPWLIFEGRSLYVDEVFTALRNRTPSSTETDDLVALLYGQRQLLRSLRRRVYFERRDEGWRKMLPYQALELLEGVTLADLQAQTTEQRERLKDCIVEAISLLEGVRHPIVRRQFICLRASQVRNASALSFRLFPKSRFALHVEDRSSVMPYLEVAPDTVTLRSNDAEIGQVSLRLSLDLLEMLEMVRHGYRPNTNDMGGLFVNLVIFRNALLHLPYTSVLVTEDDEHFYQISANSSASGQVSLQIEPRDIENVGGTP
ncbi:methylation-associated defense system protein kinase MAD6 [Leptolyngbya sp. AN02str]|jgi:serine/threonine protein kinase|uniref:methylation-associated defense system protein kinase MAD6 n=1 Tax=Leptolyngbya sp. AN02str TaxID=3423363 RepID=UPI003D320374